MKDSIIKKILEENRVSYKTTPKYFQIPREVHMNSKAPKWFSDWSTEFEKRNNARFDKLEERMDVLEAKVDRNSEMIIENRSMILKAHPEFAK